jgi:hypothetical protein
VLDTSTCPSWAVFVGVNLLTDKLVYEDEAKVIAHHWIIEGEDEVWLMDYRTNKIHIFNYQEGEWVPYATRH